MDNFNSHAHVERDLNSPLYHFTTLISTHTLTWSVTRKILKTLLIWAFQLTRSRGAWQYGTSEYPVSFTFQLTRSRGAWLWWLLETFRHQHFNSHAHVERDVLSIHIWLCFLYFNSHAHVERDRSRSRNERKMKIFQLTRSRGAWLMCVIPEILDTYFNSHAHVERDLSSR